MPEALGYAFLLEGPYCDVVLLGARSVSQLKHNLESIKQIEGRNLRSDVMDCLNSFIARSRRSDT